MLKTFWGIPFLLLYPAVAWVWKFFLCKIQNLGLTKVNVSAGKDVSRWQKLPGRTKQTPAVS
jgi:hypothetical protein